jgi:hypothetical protein
MADRLGAKRARLTKAPLLEVSPDVKPLDAPSDAPVEFELPASFGAPAGTARCRAVTAHTERVFGAFAEKTLECNAAARAAIDQMCRNGGFTQSWYRQAAPDGFMTMKKIPVLVLVHAVLGLAEDAEGAVQSLRGAYPISMDPSVRTCMNVIVGRRRPNGSGGYVLDKFSLYYPDNSAATAKWGTRWPLLDGYSFRTAAFKGSLNRASLHHLRHNSMPCTNGATFDADAHGLVIDDTSAYEDCAYVRSFDEKDEERERRIDQMVTAMAKAYGGRDGVLAPSYDPAESAAGVTVLQQEWELLKQQL